MNSYYSSNICALHPVDGALIELGYVVGDDAEKVYEAAENMNDAVLSLMKTLQVDREGETRYYGARVRQRTTESLTGYKKGAPLPKPGKVQVRISNQSVGTILKALYGDFIKHLEA